MNAAIDISALDKAHRPATAGPEGHEQDQDHALDHANDNVRFPRADGSRVPYKVFSSQAVYDREQERIFRGPTWSFLALEA
ncbi:MAG: ring hydroxylating alpha subunit family protein, partial [Rhizobacter sp.]|nr:ring hydroxylating alpha subunit family protein [Rhizobacter sp.]